MALPGRPDGLIPRIIYRLSEGTTPRNLAVLAILSAFVVVLVMLGCFLHFDGRNSPLGVLVVMFFVLSAFPLLLTKLSPYDGSSAPPPIYHIAYFLVGVFVVSAPWLTFILFRIDKITWQAGTMMMAGALLALLPISLFNYMTKKDAERRGLF